MSFDPEFLLTNPVDIGSSLKELTRSTERLMVQADPQPIGVAVVSVQVRARKFRFHPFSTQDLERLRAKPTLKFQGSAFGAQIAFEASNPQLVLPDDDDSLDAPALECDFPSQLYRMQRRQHFRAVARPNCMASWRAPQGGELKLRIFDVSLGGVGLRSRLSPEELPRVGKVLNATQLDFLDQGSVTADLQVVGLHEVIEHDFTHGQMRYMHVGCTFAQEDRLRERYLERLVRQLEMHQVA